VAPLRAEGKKEIYEVIKDVETRWNSFYDCAERAVYLQPAIDELLIEEGIEHDRYVAQCEHQGRQPQRKPPAIVADKLSLSDWAIVTQYLTVLKPLKAATKRLQGHIGGKFGAIWLVLPIYEDLLGHFEEMTQQYPINRPATEPDIHLKGPSKFSQSLPDVASQIELPPEEVPAELQFSINIDLAWQKLNEYYEKLDNTSVYVAAVVLHPRFKWKWLDNQWKKRPDWLRAAKTAFNSLKLEYGSRAPPVHSHASQPSAEKEPSEDSDDDDISNDMDQQFTDYVRDRSYKLQVESKDASPIDYWISKRFTWPHLTALALDIYSIPVMSDEPERVFSITGAAITPRRRSLHGDKVGYLMCLKAWSQSKLIEFDEYENPLKGDSHAIHLHMLQEPLFHQSGNVLRRYIYLLRASGAYIYR
jgi:hypothetical protein